MHHMYVLQKFALVIFITEYVVQSIGVPNMIEHGETQNMYFALSQLNDTATGYAAYISGFGEVRARVSLDSYRYCSDDFRQLNATNSDTCGVEAQCDNESPPCNKAENTNEKAVSLVYFGKCGTYNGDVQLKRHTTKEVGGGMQCGNGAPCNFNADSDNMVLLREEGGAPGLGKEKCYAMPTSWLSSPISTWNINATSESHYRAYDNIFRNNNLGKEYKQRKDLMGSFWGAMSQTECNNLTWSQKREARCCFLLDNSVVPVCNEETGYIYGKFFQGDKTYPGFRYVADISLTELQQSCHGVTIETDAADGSEKTTFTVAQEVFRPSQSALQPTGSQ